MSKFDKYFLMSSSDAVDYAAEKLSIFACDSELDCKEIGDGNLNYVFRVWDKKSDKSVIIKQAGYTARISDDFKLSPDRNRIEAETLRFQGDLAPGLVPIVYKYDDIMSCCSMEDLSDYTIMRQALLQHKIFPNFAEHITTFMVNTLLLTSDIFLNHQEKKSLVKSYTNPELCEITEDLVYTEPFNDYKHRNDVFPPNLDWVKKELYSDNELKLEVAKLKFEFLTNAQALIHGDLHTGSIFVNENSTKVIDPEFAFYGPMGYDVGNIIANMIFAWVNADATMDNEDESITFKSWVENTICEIIDKFKAKFFKIFREEAKEILAKTPGFSEWYLSQVLHDTAAVAGLELCRRIVGMAHVKDIISIDAESARLRAERICITIAKRYIKNRESYNFGEQFVNTLKEVENEFSQ
ncbi:S-methyl-5-thioribose kinase [Ruminiclostridium cellulolyticum]|uniref:S-methyl-5-thioribose kinase n=1 Tax=Ruminiclostridium cellulolyticum (strain ATCC 35319 / DSM 5812 / JCM 6584 / H10) TaxID=394503 RepID=B8I0R9_RUMCH|nr:S-methyl-5-thioribose kinase [Ruminiclostridium cellulolyticum]ACL75644.1 5-methylthioribose kinase [Ruminiclostridium cellulolyticum H10]